MRSETDVGKDLNGLRDLCQRPVMLLAEFPETMSCCGRIKSLLSSMVAAPQTLSAMPPPKERRWTNKVCQRLRRQKCRPYLSSRPFAVMTDYIRPRQSELHASTHGLHSSHCRPS